MHRAGKVLSADLVAERYYRGPGHDWLQEGKTKSIWSIVKRTGIFTNPSVVSDLGDDAEKRLMLRSRRR